MAINPAHYRTPYNSPEINRKLPHSPAPAPIIEEPYASISDDEEKEEGQGTTKPVPIPDRKSDKLARLWPSLDSEH